MSITLEEIIWSQIIPPSIRNDSQVQAISDALTPQIQEVSTAIKECIILARLADLDETVIDLLAWQYHVDFYDESLTKAKKIKLVKNSIEVHRHKGTAWAVSQVVNEALTPATVEEWFNYDGDPYHFRVSTESVLQTDAAYTSLLSAINSTKNLRSTFDGIYHQIETKANIYSGAIFTPHFNMALGIQLDTESTATFKGAVLMCPVFNLTLGWESSE